jgi:hypothetical protein
MSHVQLPAGWDIKKVSRGQGGDPCLEQRLARTIFDCLSLPPLTLHTHTHTHTHTGLAELTYLRLSIEGLSLAPKDGGLLGIGKNSSDPFLVFKTPKNGQLLKQSEVVTKNLHPKWNNIEVCVCVCRIVSECVIKSQDS